jgi:acetamidase/formamidase
MTQVAEKRIARENATVTEFGAHLPPVLRVQPGEVFLVETQDNFFGAIATENDLPTPDALPFLRYQFWKVNSVAGPIYVEGLQAGDLLILEIEDIIPSERGWTGFTPTFGNLARHFDSSASGIRSCARWRRADEHDGSAGWARRECDPPP